MLGTGEAYFTDADLDCSDFPFVLITQNESRLEEHVVAATSSGPSQLGSTSRQAFG